MKKRRRSLRYKGVWAVFLLLILSVLAASIIHDRRGRQVEEGEKGIQYRKDGRMGKHGPESRRSGEKAAAERITRRIAIIVDDIGYDLSPVDELLQINEPLTFSVLPHCTHSKEAAERLHRAGKEILLHLPMEPQGYPGKNPGKGVLLAGMDREELKGVLTDDLRAVPHAVGVNNHMGSKFMEDGEKLGVVFRVLKEEGLFFVDSLTTGHSRGRTMAEKTGLQFIARDIFIDNSGDAAETHGEFIRLIKAYKHRRNLVIIGHPYPGTISAIRKSVNRFRSEGIEIVPVSKLLGN